MELYLVNSTIYNTYMYIFCPKHNGTGFCLIQEPVLLSAEFLGAVTSLKWACGHLDHILLQTPSTHSSTPPQQNQSAIPTLISLFQSFPVSLNLKKKLPVLPKQNECFDSLQDATHSFPQEQWDWGQLVSHCSQAYWECLLTFLRYTSYGVATAPSCCQLQESKARVFIGCEDTMLVMTSCLEALDSAASGVGIVIEAISFLVPKVCP